MEEKIKIINSCWKAILLLKEKVSKARNKITHCSLYFGNSEEAFVNEYSEKKSQYEVVIFFKKNQNAKNSNLLLLENTISIHWQKNELPIEISKFIELYIPYCFFPILSRQKNRCIAVSHSAQSLDGNIATKSGDSKWIGNQENLVHAHRMRALCDAVVVGKHTVIFDSPKLTVRHVHGTSPIKIVIGGDEKLDFSSLLAEKEKGVLHITTEKYKKENITVVNLEKTNGHFTSLWEFLYTQQNIHSVYLEGGGQTISSFLKHKQIDVMQIHFSPLLIGEGRGFSNLPKIAKIKDAQTFNNSYFVLMGNEMMFVGVPA